MKKRQSNLQCRFSITIWSLWSMSSIGLPCFVPFSFFDSFSCNGNSKKRVYIRVTFLFIWNRTGKWAMKFHIKSHYKVVTSSSFLLLASLSTSSISYNLISKGSSLILWICLVSTHAFDEGLNITDPLPSGLSLDLAGAERLRFVPIN